MGSLFDQIPEGAKDATAVVLTGRKRGGEVKGPGPGKSRGQKQNNRVVDHEEIDGLEKMDVEKLRTLVPVLTKMVLNLAMRTRQVEAVTLITLIMCANAPPAVQARLRVKAWIEKAQEMRQRNKEDEIENAV